MQPDGPRSLQVVSVHTRLLVCMACSAGDIVDVLVLTEKMPPFSFPMEQLSPRQSHARRSDPTTPMQAVIGAGAAGLVSARVLTREGHKVTVYELGKDIGGIWLYNNNTEDDTALAWQ